MYNSLIITRGDTGILNLDLKQHNGEQYTVAEGDNCVLTVKRSVNNAEVLFQKELTDGQFIIEPSDTENLDYGTYKYDVQLTTADGKVDTVITPADFKVETEVTW